MSVENPLVFPECISQIEKEIGNSNLPIGLKSLQICIAFDVLSNLYSGSFTTTHYAKRYRSFLQKFGLLTATEAEIIYQFRSALVHNYGAFAFNSKEGKEYRFQVSIDGKLIEKKGTSTYIISSSSLEKLYFLAKEKYLKYLESYDSARQKFETINKKLGKYLLL